MSADTERFSVSPNWASLAKWLAWSMDSLHAGNLDDSAYNLTQFWGELAGWKSAPLYTAEWGDLLRMDAASNLTLADLASVQIQDALDAIQRTSRLSLVQQALTPPMGVLAALNLDPGRLTLEAFVKKLQDRRLEAARKALDMARRAASAMESAGQDSYPAQALIQAAQAAVDGSSATQAAESAGVVKATPSWADVAGGAVSDAINRLPEALARVPWWAWVALAGGLVLIPVLVSSLASRRD